MFTTHFLNILIGNGLGIQDVPPLPDQLYFGVSSTKPQIDGSGVEEPSLVGTGYGRILIDSSNLSSPIDGSITNTNEIVFNESTDNWGTMVCGVFFDGSNPSTSNLLIIADFDSSRNVEIGTTLRINPGNLRIALRNSTI